MKTYPKRSASHAGSWYSDNPNTLGNQVREWLGLSTEGSKVVKGIISPHAG